MKMKLIVGLLVIAVLPAGAQTITKKDGTTQTPKSLRRQGDNIMATIEIAGEAGAPPTTGEIGIPITQIASIDFPEPPQLKTAAELVTQGKGAEAIGQLDIALRYYEGFRDAPGSWWPDLALLKTNVLVSLGRAAEAEPLANQIARMATDPETVRGAKVQVAAAAARRGDWKGAAGMLDSIMKEATRPDTLAMAALYKGEAHLGMKEWENALLSFLQVPVFYPDQKALQPASMLGAGRAYFGIEDTTRAKDILNELITTYRSAPETEAAKVELEKIARYEKAHESP